MADVRKYKITNVNRLDEWDSSYGKMQDYSVALEGEEGWIKLTQKLQTRPPEIGDELEGFIENKSNTNGTAYRKFKKQSAEYAGRTESSNQPNSNSSQMSYIVQMLEELTGRRDVVDTVASVPDEPLQDPFEGLNI